MKLSLCESVTASGISPWCIRILTREGKKLTGGVDTASFCGRVRPPMGWDLSLDFEVYRDRVTRQDRLSESRICPRCLEALEQQSLS